MKGEGNAELREEITALSKGSWFTEEQMLEIAHKYLRLAEVI